MRGLSAADPGGAELRHHLLLAGGGHSHALLLLRWLMRPKLWPAATRVTLVSRHSTALYSGTLPALVAGLLEPVDCRIDLRRLCTLAGVSFVRAEILGLDPAARELRLQGRPPLRFDRLSLDLGAVTAMPPGASGFGQPVKPLEPFLAWLAALPAQAPLRIRGGGAAAVELALALRARGFRPRLLLRGEGLHLGSPAACRRGERLLAEAAIPVERRVPPSATADLACTGSRAPAWLEAAGLPVDAASGRVLTEASLAVIGHPGLFAVGDCAQIAAAPRPASGVWAVRATPWLAANLRRSLERPGAPLRRWHPRRQALQLIGDGGWSDRGPRALALWGPLALGPAPWLWRWKHHLDQRFLRRFAALPPLATPEAAMACRGCAAKLAAAPLEAALARLAAAAPAAVSPQAHRAEDAAVIGCAEGGQALLQSVDGFPALLDDPWLNARLTTLHACGDLWASGARVESVQALVTVPQGAPDLQEELLLQTLAGVRSVLDPLGARLLGGHTLEARDGAGLALALSVNGRADPARLWAKGPLQPGDALLLCGALGSGVLFAAARAGAARPDWIDGALDRLQRSQAPLVELLAAHGCRACTDITGFGLLGHLGEMLADPDQSVGVALRAEAVGALPGALELLDQGWRSSLAPANARALALLEGPLRWQQGEPGAARQALLIDPQTCGPLLAALPAPQAPAALAALRRSGFGEAALIGSVLAH